MIVAAELRPFRLRLRVALDTGAGRIEAREGVLLVLRDDAGRSGVGEAAPLPGHPAFAREDAGRCARVLQGASEGLIGSEPAAVWPGAAARIPAELPASRFALETALADLAARTRRLRLADWLAGRSVRERVAVNALVAGPDADAVRESACTAIAAGFSTFKLKLGFACPSQDVRRVAALRQCVGPGARIRLDANGAWSPETARDALRELARFHIEYVEDPVRVRGPDDIESLAALRRGSCVPLAADDCTSDPACVEAALACGAVDRFILKAAALGGLVATRELARRASARGVDCVLTSSLDAAVGLSASLHLAAALGSDSACGLGTAGWLAEDLAVPPPIDAGWMRLPEGFGLGLDLDGRCAREARPPSHSDD